MDAGSASFQGMPGNAAETLSGARRGLLVTFKNLTYTVNSNVEKCKKVALLSNVSGYLQPCEMMALLGPSGSGKTTLLDVLAGRKTVGKVDGNIRFGGFTPSAAFLQRYTGYVEQFDTLIGNLTVEEMMMYTAELKRPQTEPYSSKAAAVSRLLDELGLTSCKDVMIGDTMITGISGGQAKRTNIGIALISDPRVLFLDEPTSGLDSFSADEIVGLIKGLSQSGATVIATIHQPSAYAFSLFDRVMLLARGHSVYFGAQGAAAFHEFAAEAWPEFASQRSEYSLPELIMHTVMQADRAGKVTMLADAYSRSKLCQQNNDLLAAHLLCCSSSPSAESPDCQASSKLGALCDEGLDTSAGVLKPVARLDDNSSCPAALTQHSGVTQDAVITFNNPRHQAQHRHTQQDGAAVAILQMPDAELEKKLSTRNSTSTQWWWGLWVLLKYRARKDYKNPLWVLPRLVDKIIFTFITLTLYLGKGNNYDGDNLVNLAASLFMWTSLPAVAAAAYVPALVLERRLFLRERADGLYHVGTYFVAKLIEELLLAVIASVVFSACVFYAVKYQGSFVLFWLVYLFVLMIGISLGYLVAAMAPNMDVANAAIPAYGVTLLFFSGQLATLHNMPAYWRWYSWLDFLRYSWTALMVNQFEDNNPIFANNMSMLDYYSMGGANKWAHMSYLLIFFVVFTTMGYLALAWMPHAKR